MTCHEMPMGRTWEHGNKQGNDMGTRKTTQERYGNIMGMPCEYIMRRVHWLGFMAFGLVGVEVLEY